MTARELFVNFGGGEREFLFIGIRMREKEEVESTWKGRWTRLAVVGQTVAETMRYRAPGEKWVVWALRGCARVCAMPCAIRVNMVRQLSGGIRSRRFIRWWWGGSLSYTVFRGIRHVGAKSISGQRWTRSHGLTWAAGLTKDCEENCTRAAQLLVEHRKGAGSCASCTEEGVARKATKADNASKRIGRTTKTIGGKQLYDIIIAKHPRGNVTLSAHSI